MQKILPIICWLIVAWICFVFLGSVPGKFSGAPAAQHIFGTIGDWIGTFMGGSVGGLFSKFGAIGVGSFELLTSIVLLTPIVFWLTSVISRKPFDARIRRRWHRIGGLMASAVMAGAVFFHIVSPLGIAVEFNGQSDGGGLFRWAVSILVLGIVLFFLSREPSADS